jgi:hypothetical protein
MSPAGEGDRFRVAARAYFAYAVVYWIGGVYLVWHGVGIPGPVTPSRRAVYVVFWALAGLVPTLVIPYLLRRPRAWFERWLLSRRDFARILALFMAWRSVEVLRVAWRRRRWQHRAVARSRSASALPSSSWSPPPR